MIYGEPDNSDLSITEQALLQLRESEDFTFYLTGSRFFETDRADSDYDFFVEAESVDYFDPALIRRWLNQNGFEDVTLDLPAQYTDPLMVAIYKKGDVHVQLVSDVPLKRKIQDHLKKHGFGDWLISKSFSRKIWRLLVDVCKENNNEKQAD